MLLLLALVWLAGTVQAKTPEFGFAEPYFESVGDNESIPGGVISALLIDARGWLWIGTQKGLMRYDGYRFRKFVHRQNDPASLAGDFVRCLWSDAQGRIWAGTVSDGLSMYDPGSERFQNFRHDANIASSISGGQIYALMGDTRGGLWLATNEGLDYLAKNSVHFMHFRHDPHDPRSLSDNRVRTVVQDKQGRIWVGTASGVQRMLPDGQHFERIGSDPLDPESMHKKEVWQIFEAQDGKLWLGTFSHGAAFIDPATLQLKRLPLNPANKEALSHGWVDAITQPHSDQIWLGSAGGGITVVSAGDGRVLQHLRSDPANPASLASDNLGSMFKDSAGWLWVGTWGAGLQRHNTRNQAFRSVRHSLNQPQGLSHANVYGILEQADGTLLVGTDGKGIDILDRQQGLIGGYRSYANEAPRKLPGKPGALLDATITALLKTADGALLAGTRQAGVLRLAPGVRSWQKVDGLPGPQVYRLLAAKNGDVWAATNNGVARWQAGRSGFEIVAKEDGQALQASAYALAEDNQGRIWLGSNIGLWVQQAGVVGLRRIQADSSQPDSLLSNSVRGLLFDSQAQLWVSTALGLERLRSWDGKQAQFDHINAMAGKENGEVGYNLLEDQFGRIWTGEQVLDTRAMRFIPLTRADGFDIGGNWVGAYGKTHDNLLLYGGTRGLVIIQPERFKVWDFQPQVVLSELKINGKTQGMGELGRNRIVPLTLKPGERDFSIEFAALDYSQPAKNHYRYRLQGYEEEWIDADADHRSASYGNLWPGQYQLQVQGSNRLGNWSPHELQIPIHVLPAFWQRAWFMLLALLLLLASLVLAYRWRVARIERREHGLQKLIAARTADILKLGEIGQELTATIDTEQAFERVYAQVRARLDAHVFGIAFLENDTIRFEYLIEAEQRQKVVEYPMHESNRPAVWCVREQRELVAATRLELLNYVDAIMPVKNGKPTESIIFLPLIAEKQVIGCLTVQSAQKYAFNLSQLEFLRVLASYSAIAIANSRAHKNLLATQQQLVQQEKMATLGHLVANVAHEINTPIGAVKASGVNIARALEEAMHDLPKLFALLDSTQQARFQRLLDQCRHDSGLLTSREERALARELIPQLEQAGIQNPRYKASLLVQLGGHLIVPEILPLLRHPQSDFIVKTANSIASIISNTSNINLAVARVSKIVFALKSFSHTDYRGQMVPTDLAQDLETVITIYQHQIRHGITLVRHYEPIAPLLCMADELNQVWTNLIHNALHAMNMEGTLTLTVRRVGNEAMVSIGDTGCGIPEAIRSKIFDAFFTTKPAGEGSGLGLDISKKIIEKHHGRIEVASQVGAGSTFSIFLPYPITD